MKSLCAAFVLFALAAPVAAQSNVSAPHAFEAAPSSPSSFLTPHGEVTQFTYRVVVPAGKCVVVTGEQWFHPGGPRLPFALGEFRQARLTTASIKAAGKSVGLTAFANGIAVATDGDGVAGFPDGLLLNGPTLTVQVFNPSSLPQWAYLVVQVTSPSEARR